MTGVPHPPLESLYQQLILENPSAFTHERYYAAVHTSYEACVKHKRVAPEAGVALHVDAKLITVYLERHLKAVEVIEADNIDVQAADGYSLPYSFLSTQRRPRCNG